MKILDKKLEDIIVRSGLYFYEKEIETEIATKHKLVSIKEAMQKTWADLPDDANIAIYGMGYHFNEQFANIDLSTKNLICMIDKRPELTEFKGYPVIRVEELPNYNIDVVLITSWLYCVEMEKNVKNVSADCKVICAAENFTQRLQYVNYEDVQHGNMTEDDYIRTLSLNSAVKIYYKTNNYKYLLYIIKSYLYFRDLNSALFFIDRYIKAELNTELKAALPDIDKMSAFKRCLLNLTDEMRHKLSLNKHTHCVVVISDSVSAASFTAENVPFLYDFAQNNINCVNAYTHMCCTSTSFLSMFKQKSFIDNHLYGNPVISAEEPILNNLSANGIAFKLYSAYGKSVFVNIDNFTACGKGCAEMLWQYLCSSYENDENMVCFFHLAETHSPFLNLYPIDTPDNADDRNLHYYSLKYLDAQMAYFLDLLPVSTRMILSSDHGQGSPDYSNSRCHIPYIICDRLTHTGCVERLVSHLETVDIVMNLVNNKPAFDGMSEKTLVEVNGEFFYALRLKHKLDHEPAFKCFISKWDKYVIFCNGVEMYFLLPGDSENLIDDPKHAERINWFRENVNTIFPDWSDDNGRYDITRTYMDINKKIKK